VSYLLTQPTLQVSPENILIAEDGGGLLIDFGAAVPLARVSETSAGEFVFDVSHGDTLHTSNGSQLLSSDSAQRSLNGWAALLPPSGNPFCKLAYACPQYVWRQPWYGVAGDLYSVGLALYFAAEGRPLYVVPSALDPHFALLLPRGEGGPPRFAAWMRERHRRAGALSKELINLLVGLLRGAPHERPPSAAAVLEHKWFRGD
jgi:serine/threonine protein kinase